MGSWGGRYVIRGRLRKKLGAWRDWQKQKCSCMKVGLNWRLGSTFITIVACFFFFNQENAIDMWFNCSFLKNVTKQWWSFNHGPTANMGGHIFERFGSSESGTFDNVFIANNRVIIWVRSINSWTHINGLDLKGTVPWISTREMVTYS